MQHSEKTLGDLKWFCRVFCDDKLACETVSFAWKKTTTRSKGLNPQVLDWAHTISVPTFASSESSSFWRFRSASWLLLCDDSSAYNRQHNQRAVSKKPGSHSKVSLSVECSNLRSDAFSWNRIWSATQPIKKISAGKFCVYESIVNLIRSIRLTRQCLIHGAKWPSLWCCE